MNNIPKFTRNFAIKNAALVIMAGVAFLLFFIPAAAQTQISESPDKSTLIVDDAPEMEVYALGKSVIVKKRAKGVLAFGGDIVIEGRVEGDVAAIGGSIIQKQDAYIGGDVIAFGGSYKPESQQPLREPGKETIMFAAFEEELRDIAQNPSQIFSPTMTVAFFAQRLLSVLFWFIVSLGLTTIAPGAVSRAIARFQLSTLKVIGIGFASFLVIVIGVLASFRVLPDYMGAIVGLMAFIILMLAYVFGRVAIQVSIGKLIQKYVLGEKVRSEALAILFGVLFLTVLLSIPYLWIFALIALFAGGIGLVATARSKTTWRTQ